MIGLSWWSHSIQRPLAQPEWAKLVPRWYQLDAPAMALAETYWKFRTSLGDSPYTLILASPEGSNDTDRTFARALVPSPAKFVHTLANVRIAPMLQLMNWHGPVYCLQKDPFTLTSALCEASWLARETPEKDIWFVSAIEHEQVWTGHLTSLRVNDFRRELKIEEASPLTRARPPERDSDLLFWIQNRTDKFLSLGEFALSKMPKLDPEIFIEVGERH